MGKSLNVLLADDEPMILKSVSRYLRGQACRIVACSDGNDALGKAESGTFDVVIADLELPVSNGTNLVESLLRIRPGGRMIVISGHIEPGADWPARGAANVTFLPKPFDLEILARLVTAAAGQGAVE